MAEHDFKEIYEKLLHYCRIRTSPVAIKWFHDIEDMKAIPSIELIGRRGTACLIIAAAARQNRTMGITAEDFIHTHCRAANGFGPRSERWLSAVPLIDRWHSNKEAAESHHASMTHLSVGDYQALAAAPLQSGNIADPDVVGVFATPAQAFMILAAYLNINHKKLDFHFNGESSCSESWVATKATGKPGINFGDMGGKWFGHMAEDELLLTMTLADVELTLKGADNLNAAGIVYPISGMGLDTGDPMEVQPPAFLEE